MSDDEINRAIAELCGWKCRTEGMLWSELEHRACILRGSELERVRRKMGLPMEGNVLSPDYAHDLDAIHEAEKMLNQSQRVSYVRLLQTLCWDRKLGDSCFATARQRCEALLRTLSTTNPTPRKERRRRDE